MDLFELVGTIAIKNSDAVKALDETADKGQKTESKLSGAFSKIGKGALAVGKVAGGALVAGATAIGALTVKAMNLAGELEQNMGGSEQVFGEYAGKMQETAKNAFSNMGLSTSDFLATANKMGALFQGAGFTIEESSGLASDAMQRAADVASIMGIDTSAAMEAIAGAAKGNFTMMDNLGVAMNDTTLQAYALEKGIQKSTQEMTNQEKIGLAMEMFMEKTAYAAGNYARENQTLAGSLGTAKAALTNFLDGSGDVDQLVTAFSNAANVIVSNLTQILPRLVTGLTSMIGQIVPLIPPLLQQLLPAVIDGAASLISGVISALPSVVDLLVNSAIPMLLSGLVTLIGSLISALPSLVQTIASALPVLAPQLVNGLVELILALCTNLPLIIQPIIAMLPELYLQLVTALMGNLDILIAGLLDLVIAVVDMIPTLVLALVDAGPIIIQQVLLGIVNAFPELIVGICELIPKLFIALLAAFSMQFISLFVWIKGIWLTIKDYVMPGLEAIKNVIMVVFDAVKAYFVNVFNVYKTIFTTAWNIIKTAVTTVINALKTVIMAVFNAVKTYITNVLNGYKLIFTTVWNFIRNTVSNVVNGIRNTIVNVFTAVKNTVGNIFNSIKDKMSKPIEKARDTIKGIVDKIKGFFSGMNISFPHIKLPHFSIKPAGWEIGDLLKGEIPSLGIEWYAKAMNDAMVMTKPTIFGYNPATGQLMGGGEAGTEVVSGADTLMNMIGNAVNQSNAGGNAATVDALETIIVLMQEMLQAVLAGHVLNLNGREVGRMVKQYA